MEIDQSSDEAGFLRAVANGGLGGLESSMVVVHANRDSFQLGQVLWSVPIGKKFLVTPPKRGEPGGGGPVVEELTKARTGAWANRLGEPIGAMYSRVALSGSSVIRVFRLIAVDDPDDELSGFQGWAFDLATHERVWFLNDYQFPGSSFRLFRQARDAGEEPWMGLYELQEFR